MIELESVFPPTVRRSGPPAPKRAPESMTMRWLGYWLTMVSVVVIICLFPLSIIVCLDVINEFETIVVFRNGRLSTKKGTKGPGVVIIIPCVDSYHVVDLREQTFDVRPQKILTKDSISCDIDAVVYYRVVNATAAVVNVADYANATKLLAQTVLRNVMGTKTFSEILSQMADISHQMLTNLLEITDEWGVRVNRIDVKNVRLPTAFQRAMACEAEALREARAKVIDAEGEQEASVALSEAALMLDESECAIQLRLLQTLTSIAGQQNRTIVLPVPPELFGY